MPELLTVSQLAAYLTDLVRDDETLADVLVTGEISNATLASSGHFYFSLKDASASLACVMWRPAVRLLPETPQAGQNVVARGRVDFYALRGQLQLVVEALRVERGVGDLYRQFEEAKARLQAEGLFDPARKRPLPIRPQRIGLVTSGSGAALRDILRVLAQRWPLADVLLVPGLVQGEQAPASLQAALYTLYARGDIDVIIIARGGGSIEDLWAFNDEGLARLLAASPAPTVTGIGHETDFTLADFVADQRAPTPSAAAAAVVPDQQAVRAELLAAAGRLAAAVRGEIAGRRQTVERLEAVVRRHSPRYRIDQRRQMVDDLDHRLTLTWTTTSQRRRLALAGLEQRLAALNPSAVLSRGYAIVRDESGRVIQSVAQTSPGQPLTIRVHDGSFGARVEGGGRDGGTQRGGDGGTQRR